MSEDYTQSLTRQRRMTEHNIADKPTTLPDLGDDISQVQKTRVGRSLSVNSGKPKDRIPEPILGAKKTVTRTTSSEIEKSKATGVLFKAAIFRKTSIVHAWREHYGVLVEIDNERFLRLYARAEDYMLDSKPVKVVNLAGYKVRPIYPTKAFAGHVIMLEDPNQEDKHPKESIFLAAVDSQDQNAWLFALEDVTFKGDLNLRFSVASSNISSGML